MTLTRIDSSVTLFSITLGFACISCGPSDDGFSHGFGAGELDIVSTPTVVDVNGQPAEDAFVGFFMSIEQEGPEDSPDVALTEITVSGDGPFSGSFTKGTLAIKLHATPTTGVPMTMTSFFGEPDPGEAKVLYSSRQGDTATGTGTFVVERHDFAPEGGGSDARLSVKLSFDGVELGGNGVPPYTVDGILELRGVDSDPKPPKDTEPGGGPGGDPIVFTCEDTGAGVCIVYTVETDADRDRLQPQCGANFVGSGRSCGGGGYCRHRCGVPGERACTSTEQSTISDTYDSRLDEATLRQVCTDTDGIWNG